jgi:hypothetical protein
MAFPNLDRSGQNQKKKKKTKKAKKIGSDQKEGADFSDSPD